MSKAGFEKLMRMAVGDAQFADAMVALVGDAVDDAMQTAVVGSDDGVAGRVAGQRLRDALTSHRATVGRSGGALTPRERTEGRARAFRMMAGVRV